MKESSLSLMPCSPDWRVADRQQRRHAGAGPPQATNPPQPGCPLARPVPRHLGGHRLNFGLRRIDRLLHRLLDRLDAFVHAAFKATCRRLHFRLQALQFVKLDFTADVGLDVVDVALQATEQQAGRPRHARQTLRADHHQRNDGNDHQFGKADVKHLG